jgi:predicted glutamine amidotransferase
LAIQESNSHPFLRNGISFIHNGAIKPPESIDSLIDPALAREMNGTTDSERYFYAILTAMKSGNLLDSAITTVNEIKRSAKYSSLNAMLLTDKQFIAYAEYDNDRIPEGEAADYYELFYKETDDGVIVASSGWPQDGWIEIPNHSGIVVDRASVALRHFTL